MTNGKFHYGNMIFKHKYASIDLEGALERVDSFEEFENDYMDELIEGNVLLSDFFGKLMKKYVVTRRELSEATGYNYDYYCKVLKGTRDNPDRDFLLASCLYMRTSVEEAQALLRYAGQQPLYARRRRDALIWFALWKKRGLTELDIYLDERGYSPLKKFSKDDEE